VVQAIADTQLALAGDAEFAASSYKLEMPILIADAWKSWRRLRRFCRKAHFPQIHSYEDTTMTTYPRRRNHAFAARIARRVGSGPRDQRTTHQAGTDAGKGSHGLSGRVCGDCRREVETLICCLKTARQDADCVSDSKKRTTASASLPPALACISSVMPCGPFDAARSG
jgi:hypothetical protein